MRDLRRDASRSAPRCGPDRRSRRTARSCGAPGVTAGRIAFVTTSSTWSVSNTASSTTSQRATSSSARRHAAGLRERRGLRGVDVVALRVEARADQPVRQRAAEQAEPRDADRCAPWSCAGDLVEDREQRLRIGDVRIVARVDLVGASSPRAARADRTGGSCRRCRPSLHRCRSAASRARPTISASWRRPCSGCGLRRGAAQA